MPRLLGLGLLLSAGLAQDPAAEAVARFLAAESGDERRAAAEQVVATGAPFEAVRDLLRRGRDYADDVPRGRILRSRVGSDGLDHKVLILVPEDYDPGRALPVRMNLHGGMGAPEWKELDGSWAGGWRPQSDQIVILPAGWWDSMWWEHSQAENLEAILADVKRTWNVDEDRVVLFGNSDGGAALFFYAFRQPDRWSGYAGFVGPPDRLARGNLRPDGQMHLSNLRGQRFHLGYGEDDPLCPIEHIRRYMALFQEHGADLDWYANEGQEHSLSLTAEQERAFGRFLWGTPRDPLPERLTWATERTDRYNRRGWLVIDELVEPERGHEVDTSNVLPRWGTRIQLRGPDMEPRPWGRVELEREGNTVRAATRRVARFTLLVSPDELDLSRPIEVVVDGKMLFRGVVEPSLEVLVRWALVDDDRRLLFAAEIPIVLGEEG